MQTLDRYVIREFVPPFLLALALFTFVLAVNPMLDQARNLLATGVPIPTVAWLLLLLVPQAMSLTVPMAFLTGVLMALGRISGDRESVALLGCGVSPLRILRPLLLTAIVVAGLDAYVLMKVKPDANQAYREIAFGELAERMSADIRPRVFFERFPGLVLYIGDSTPSGEWLNVLLANTTEPRRPAVTLAATGKLVLDREQREARLVLGNATQYTPGRADERVYTTLRQDPLILTLTADSVFGAPGVSYDRGHPEMTWAMLREAAARNRAEGISDHNEILHMQQMISFPAACIVFALLGLALGFNTRREGRLASLAIGLAIIAVYWMLMEVAAGWVKGEASRGGVSFPAVWARWVPNIVLGLAGLLSVWWLARGGHTHPLLSVPAFLRRWKATGPAPGSQAGAAVRPFVVLRLPEFRIPGPRLLDRYVGRTYLRMVGLAFLSLLVLYYLAEIVDLSEKVFKQQAGLEMLGAYLWHATPQFVAYVVPVAALVAVLGTIGALSRSGEIVVMRACGVSLYRAAVPLILFGLVWAGLLFVLEDRVLGASNRTASELRGTIRSGTPHTIDVANLTWMIGDDGRIYHYLVFEKTSRRNGNRPVVHNLSVFETTRAPYQMNRHTYVEQAVFDGSGWQARSGWTHVFTNDSVSRETFDAARLPLPPVQDFERAQVDASNMSYSELRDYVRRLGASGFNVSEQTVNLYRKIAFPAAAVVMTLLAIPFGVTTGRKGAMYGIGLAIVLAATYFLLQAGFLAAGAAAVLPPALAAWAPNLVFAAGAVFLMLTVKT